MKIINNHIYNVEICNDGCNELVSLINNNGKNAYLDKIKYFYKILFNYEDNNKGRIIREGGIETVINVMNEHIDNSPVCTNCCIIIGEIIQFDG